MTKYVEDTYNKIAEEYTEEFFADTSDLPLIRMLTKQLNPGAKVIDIGCGPGQFSEYLHSQGFNVVGIDNSDEMIRIAEKKVPTVSFLKMDMRKLDFPEESFDGILAAYSIIHIPTEQIEQVLAQMYRVLKPGGYALFITQVGEPDQVLDEPLARGEKIFMNFFSEERIATFVTKAGFKLVQQKSINQSSNEVLSSTVVGTLAMRV